MPVLSFLRPQPLVHCWAFKSDSEYILNSAVALFTHTGSENYRLAPQSELPPVHATRLAGQRGHLFAQRGARRVPRVARARAGQRVERRLRLGPGLKLADAGRRRRAEPARARVPALRPAVRRGGGRVRGQAARAAPLTHSRGSFITQGLYYGCTTTASGRFAGGTRRGGGA